LGHGAFTAVEALRNAKREISQQSERKATNRNNFLTRGSDTEFPERAGFTIYYW
jgi:hypothetical protein